MDTSGVTAMFQSFGRLRLFRWLAVSLVAGTAVPAAAQGDLLVAPTRVVINGGGASQVILSNIGEKPATYRITLELRRMTTSGDTVDVAEAEATPQERAALDMVRYAPRRITLQPNQPQAVRISARPPEGLADGEYRVHMSFRGIPDPTPVAAPTDGAPPSAQGLSIRLTPIYGITIPVIVRQGQLQAGATLAHPRIERAGATGQLHLDLTRSGDRSVYGEVRVLVPGQRDPVMLVRGIAIYPEVTGRKLALPVTADQLARLRGPVRIEYREPPETGGALIAALDANLR